VTVIGTISSSKRPASARRCRALLAAHAVLVLTLARNAVALSDLFRCLQNAPVDPGLVGGEPQALAA